MINYQVGVGIRRPSLSGRACWSLPVYLPPKVFGRRSRLGGKCLPGMTTRGGYPGVGNTRGGYPGGSRGGGDLPRHPFHAYSSKNSSLSLSLSLFYIIIIILFINIIIIVSKLSFILSILSLFYQYYHAFINIIILLSILSFFYQI